MCVIGFVFLFERRDPYLRLLATLPGHLFEHSSASTSATTSNTGTGTSTSNATTVATGTGTFGAAVGLGPQGHVLVGCPGENGGT